MKTIGGAAVEACSPLRRGWSHQPGRPHVLHDVLPAQAGVVPLPTPLYERHTSAPRSGGGGPNGNFGKQTYDECSPLRRGWSRADVEARQCGAVLPAQAGVILGVGASVQFNKVLPAQAGVVPVEG